MATILYRYSELKGYDVSASASLDMFSDFKDISGYAVKEAAWAVSEGLITGSGENGKTILAPKAGATRAQVATILMRFCEKY